MSISQTIHQDHLGRLAVVYVRQSSPHQALANQESLKLQYDLRHRARAAGWDPSHIRVIDSDLGRDGAASRSSWPWSTRNKWASSSPTTSPGWPAIAPTGISCSIYVDIVVASSATRM